MSGRRGFGEGWSGLSPVPPACCFSGPARVGDWDFCELLFLGPRRANLGAADPGGTARESVCEEWWGPTPRRAAKHFSLAASLFTRRTRSMLHRRSLESDEATVTELGPCRKRKSIGQSSDWILNLTIKFRLQIPIPTLFSR